MSESNSNVIPAINAVDGFNPADFVRTTVGEEGENDLYLDVKYRLLWFRLHHPNGKIDPELIRVDEKSTQPAQQQVQPPVQQSHAPAPEPPKTLDEYLRVMTIEQAKAVKVDFGRFSGWSLGEIAMKSPGDLAWYVKNYSGHNLALKAGATKLLETVGQMAS